MMGPMPPAPLTGVRLEPGRYRHFKGGVYEVLSVGQHTETEELLVVYRSVDDPATVWVRPLEMFADHVEGPDGVSPRFEPAHVRAGLHAAIVRGVTQAIRAAVRQPLRLRTQISTVAPIRVPTRPAGPPQELPQD
jgi:hypothetical protein